MIFFGPLSERFSLGSAFGAALTGHRFFDLRHAFVIRLRHSLEQIIRRGFKRLTQAGQRGNGKQGSSRFNVNDGLPVNSSQFRQAFLRQIGSNTGGFHVFPHEAQNFSVRHP